MSRVTLHLDAIRHNLDTVDGWIKAHGADRLVAAKVLCGHAPSLEALRTLGVRQIGDSRIEHLRVIERVFPNVEPWFLRAPARDAVGEVVRHCPVSLNSEVEVIEALNEEAGRRNKRHGIVLMIELGDLREGMEPEELVRMAARVCNLEHIRIVGLGANLGCMSMDPIREEPFRRLARCRDELSRVPALNTHLISVGGSAILRLLRDGRIPPFVNHLRIGEAIFLGTDPVDGRVLPGLRGDTALLEAEVLEIKRKGDVGRALVDVGYLDTDISGLTPVDVRHRLAGKSSDVAAVELDADAPLLSVGDMIGFRVNYAALLQVMGSRYVAKRVHPALNASTSGAAGARHE